MRTGIMINELFNCKTPYLQRLFNAYCYPWEMLPVLKEYITALISSGIPGYKMIDHMVLAGENADIHPSAVIMPYTIIGENSCIRPGAYVRGLVITGSSCVIGNSSEVKSSILLDNVQIPHYNYVGDSVLGNNAHMGAGSVCSNLKSDRKNVIIHSDPPIETNLRKIGGILADGVDVGCGCVLNPGTIIAKNTRVYPLNSLRGIYPSNSIVKSPSDIVPIV